jgi:hypothetical protein
MAQAMNRFEIIKLGERCHRNSLSIFIKPRRHAKPREENDIEKLNKKFLEVRYQRNLFIKRFVVVGGKVDG